MQNGVVLSFFSYFFARGKDGGRPARCLPRKWRGGRNEDGDTGVGRVDARRSRGADGNEGDVRDALCEIVGVRPTLCAHSGCGSRM